MKKILLSFLIILTFICCFAQKKETIIKQYTHFQIFNKSDIVDFIVADTILNQKKPVFLFCQGSLPVPLFIDFGNDGIYNVGGGISNFDINKIKKYYHLVLISMPHTPILVDKKHVNNSYCYIPDTTQNKFSNEFLKSDYLENYVNRANAVLNYLKKQKWVDNSQLIVSGHSQGCKVAIKIAAANKNVTKLGIFSPNVFGRIDEFIRRARKDAEKGNIEWQSADSIMNSQYSLYKYVCEDNLLELDPSYISWKSFSKPLINDLLKTQASIYMAYGTSDITSDLCDLVPLYFIERRKKNITYKRYINLEHNFFEVDNGKTNYNKPNWDKVMSNFIEWSRSFSLRQE